MLEGAQATLEVDLDALKGNWRLLAARVAPAECAAVVKADAYGLGIDHVVPALARAGCRTFFVAHLAEGVRARKALRAAKFWPDSASRIFLLHGLQPGPMIHRHAFAYRLGPVLGSPAELALWAAEAGHRWNAPPAAIQIDTGMNRIGLDPGATAALTPDRVADTGATLLMSHFLAAEEPAHPSNAAQIEAFDRARAGIFPGLAASLANSSGIFLPHDAHYDLVRPGYALYGGNPCPGQANPMRSVVSLSAAVLQTRWIEAGETVGYNGRWVAQRPTYLATIGIGYADGVPRGARTVGTGDGPYAMARGVPCPLVGRISMDLSVLDVTDAPPEAVGPGQAVALLGRGITIDDFGARAGTIGYEILTNLGRRYHRAYVETAD